MIGVGLVLLGVVLTLVAQHLERDADRERRLVGLAPFTGPSSNVRTIDKPYDQEADRG